MSDKQVIHIFKENKPATPVQTGSPGNIITNAPQQPEEANNLSWSMYQEMVVQNTAMKEFISDITQAFVKLYSTASNKEIKNTLLSVLPAPVARFVSEAQEIPVESLTFAMLRKYTGYFCELYNNPFRRMDGLHNLLQLLYNLHQLGGKADKETLFIKSGVADVTGYRIISKLKELSFVKTSGTKFNSYYEITPVGLDFLNLKLTLETARTNTWKTSSMYRNTVE